MRRIEFFVDKFSGIGMGLSFGFYDKHFYLVGTILCFNIYFELNFGKIY